jgi:hypothetical protein
MLGTSFNWTHNSRNETGGEAALQLADAGQGRPRRDDDWSAARSGGDMCSSFSVQAASFWQWAERSQPIKDR